MTTVTRSVSVLVVEDHELLAETLRLALSEEGIPAATVAPTSTADVLAAAGHLHPGVVLLDLDLGEPIGDGSALVQPLVELDSAVLVLTGITEHTRVAVALEAGAVGWLSKTAPFDRFLAVVLDALAGRPVLGDAERFELLALLRRRRAGERRRHAPFMRLSPREQQVLLELADGHGVAAIARRHHVAEATVRTQVRGVLTKLGVRNQLEAVALARDAGWLDRATMAPEGSGRDIARTLGTDEP